MGRLFCCFPCVSLNRVYFNSPSIIKEGTMSSLHKVFVYGTLKRGEPNHHWITNTKKGVAQFIGTAQTINKFPLVIGTKYNIPFLLDSPGTGNAVTGEVYSVDEPMLLHLDELEDHPNFYMRRKETVKIELNGETADTWIYFITKFKDGLLNGPFYTSYSSKGAHGLEYRESEAVTPVTVKDL